ncbi:MAG: insulinase family protein [Spirochaetaceae bacterium]|jgi:Zn-dependent M16 (insulinase) family peptidase|nr:insulinase family protein [Spirochaetaceae bacterium]
MKTRKTALCAGKVLESGFEILETPLLEELGATGIWARHQNTGLEVFHVLNDDEENLFAFAFATIPEDSAGAAHILEHSVLCGSENYPLKDTFLILEQGSLQTYLNAWTFPDKTVYPASSTNERDYFNLMGVYGDAVFKPLLTKWTFLQEGWRLAFLPTPKEGARGGGAEEAAFTGVVYNEMLGAFSSPDRYIQHWSVAGVLTDTPYAFESGGDPEHIPDLTWENLREFHKTRYSPANCRVFLAGSIPTEKQLAFIAETLLPGLPAGKAAPPVPKASRWPAPRTVTAPCPPYKPRRFTVTLSWLCGDSSDSLESLSLTALSAVLTGHDGSPLSRALVDSGLGEDLTPSTGLETDLRETVMTVGLRGVELKPDREKEVEAFIMDTLRRLFEEGIPKEEIEAALLLLEFSHREFKRADGPWSLMWLQRSLRGWLHGAKPWERLLFMPAFTALKARIAADSRYFENLMKKYLLDNPHRALVAMKPDEDFIKKHHDTVAARINALVSRLGREGVAELKAEAAALEKLQDAEDPPETLALIPHLSRSDLSPAIDRIPRTVADASGIPVMGHDLFTNGITYIDLGFPVDIFAPEDYLWLPLFSKFVVCMGLPGLDYGNVSSLMARTLGGFYGLLESSSTVPGTRRAADLPAGFRETLDRDWLIYRVKALDEKIAPCLDIVLRIILEADFTDYRRITVLLAELRNDLDATLVPLGNTYVSERAGRRISKAATLKEIWRGLRQFRFIHSLENVPVEEISAALTRIRDTLASRAGLIVNITGSGDTFGASLAHIGACFGRFGPPGANNPLTADAKSFHPLLGEGAADTAPGADEVYTVPNIHVGFAGMTVRAAPFSPSDQAIEKVLAHGLATGALWEDIRMKGGAYGAFASADLIESAFEFSTYRDPNPLRSLDAFHAALRRTGRAGFDEEFLEKSIIGVYAKETHPLSITDKSIADFLRFIIGFEDPYRAARREKLLAVTAEEVRDAASRLAKERPSMVILADPVLAERAAAALGGIPVQELSPHPKA